MVKILCDQAVISESIRFICLAVYDIVQTKEKSEEYLEGSSL